MYCVDHEFKEGQESQAEILRDDIINHAEKSRLPRRVAVELTEDELSRILTSDFDSIKQELHDTNEHWREEYFRFWHSVVHALKDHVELAPIDHQEIKTAQDQALIAKQYPAAYEYFQQRSKHLGNQLLKKQFLAALVGTNQLQGKNGTQTGLHARLKAKANVCVNWFKQESDGRFRVVHLK